MEERLAEELQQIVRSIKRLSKTSLSFGGQVISCSDSDGEPEGRSDLLVQQLGKLLYLHCYSRKFNGAITQAVTTSPTADEQFLEQLSAANSSREHMDRGWRILRQLPTGHYIAEKNGLTRLLFAGEFISTNDIRGPVTDGTSISIFCPRESRTMHQGFYYIFGETLGDQLDDTGLLRFYWNIKAEGAIELVRLLTGQLNRFQLPFRLKVVNNPADYDRRDAAILYINERYYRVTSELLTKIHQQVTPWLNGDSPLFCKQLLPGLGMAEEPTTGESFGQQRCRILAKALCEIGLEGEEMEVIKKQFEINGLSLDYPYRNPGSNRSYSP